MKKRVFLVFVILSIAAVANVHAFGLGAQYNFNPSACFGEDTSITHGFSVLLSPVEQLHIAASYYIPQPGFRTWNGISATFDYSPKFLSFRLFPSARGKLIDTATWWCSFSVGIGAYFNMWLEKPEDKIGISRFSGGLRLPIGFNFLLVSGRFDVFAHCAPSVGLSFYDREKRAADVKMGEWSFPVEVGGRVWLGKKKTY